MDGTFTRSLEYQLVESIEIEVSSIINKIDFAEGELQIELNNSEVLNSMVLVAFYAKTLTYNQYSDHSEPIVTGIEAMLNQLNGNQGYRSRRLKELMLAISTIDAPEKVTPRKLEQKISEDSSLADLIKSIERDLKLLFRKDRKKFHNITYCLLKLHQYLKKKKINYPLFEFIEDHIDEDFKHDINKIFSPGRSRMKHTKELLMNVIFLKELPLLFIGLISLFSFFIGNQWEKNLFIFDHQESREATAEEVGEFFTLHQLNSSCCNKVKTGRSLYRHSYKINFTSLQNDQLENIKLLVRNPSTRDTAVFYFEYKNHPEKRKPDVTIFPPTGCASRVTLTIENLEKDFKHNFYVFSANKERPQILPKEVSREAIIKTNPTSLATLIYLINNYSEIILIVLVVIFTFYIIAYAKHRA